MDGFEASYNLQHLQTGQPDESGKHEVEFVVSGRNGSVNFQPLEEALHLVAFLVQLLVMRPGLLAILFYFGGTTGLYLSIHAVIRVLSSE